MPRFSCNIRKFDGFEAYFDNPSQLLFCNNETRHRNQSSYGAFKDAFHEYVVNQKQDAVNSSHVGSKAAGLWDFELSPGEERCVRLRLRAPAGNASLMGRDPALASGNGNARGSLGAASQPTSLAFADFDEVFNRRIREADEFYDEVATLACRRTISDAFNDRRSPA